MLARKTIWEEIAPDAHRGLGQRILTTDNEEVPLLEIRAITLNAVEETESADAGDHA